MKFDELDERMRVFETALDLCVLPGMYMVARLDGRSFTRLTKEVHQFEAPFDPRFRDMMLADRRTSDGRLRVQHASYGYTQSDEISLLFASGGEQLPAKTPQAALGPVRGGERASSPCCWGPWRPSTAASRNCPRSISWSITSAGATRTLTATP